MKVEIECQIENNVEYISKILMVIGEHGQSRKMEKNYDLFRCMPILGGYNSRHN